MSKRDYYEVLGLPRHATPAEVRQAHRRLAKLFHPDQNRHDAAAEAKFKEVQEAYAVLSDVRRRAIYDRFGQSAHAGNGNGSNGGNHANPSNGQRPPRPGADPSDQSGSGGAFLGSRAHRVRPATVPTRFRPVDLERTVNLSFEQAVHGTLVEIDVPNLNGRFKVETIRVRIPAGVQNDQRIRLRDRGAEIFPGGPRGDLYLTCRVRAHAYFVRIGMDIHLDLPIGVHEAVLGTKVSIPTIDGYTTISIPAGTNSDAKLRLRGKGVYGADRQSRGDQYVHIQIVAPQGITAEQRLAMQRFAETDHSRPRAHVPWASEGK